jgi:hypothetical protein
MLLAIVMFIALTSNPFPFRQYMNGPQVLLVYDFPTSWIVSVAVAGGAQNQQCRALASDRLDASVNCRNRGLPFRQSASGVH